MKTKFDIQNLKGDSGKAIKLISCPLKDRMKVFKSFKKENPKWILYKHFIIVKPSGEQVCQLYFMKNKTLQIFEDEQIRIWNILSGKPEQKILKRIQTAQQLKLALQKEYKRFQKRVVDLYTSYLGGK